MKDLKLIIALLLMLSISVASAQKRIDGNGIQTTSVRDLPIFTTIDIELNGKIKINCQQKPAAKVMVDANLQELIVTEVRGNTLYITQSGWPEPTKDFNLEISVPFLSHIRNDSWSEVQINDLVTRDFLLESTIGDMKVGGKVEYLKVVSKKAQLDLRNLRTENAEISISGAGEVRIDQVENLTSKVSSRGTLFYNGEVMRIEEQRSDQILNNAPLEYVKVKIRNNSLYFPPLRIEGPKSHPFSYGFRIFPGTSKTEKVPVGTKIYRARDSAAEELLLTIEKSDANKSLKLF